ncbi:hypothetical protein [Streptomyces sp. JJ36]|uniref:allene oxide cyclase barrel-like domain-containing protein n=1 Tax=Streptomyces sp. JJ36 TaxID=2736645 RepID=UPI001F19775F|nr:hypothetical protein [Streptomyces sp. JJ36]MCF6525398.1 hypothetical protein [Streptomyces sp. JJ36]
MNIGKSHIRRATVGTCAAVLASLTVTGGGPTGDHHGGAAGHEPRETRAGKSPATSGDDRSHGRRPPGKDHTGRSFTVRTGLQVAEELDLGTPGRSVGDQFVFSGDLFAADEEDGPPVGTVGGYCVLTEVARNAGQCSLTAVLDEGQITVQGEQEGIPTPRPVTNAVTGGTGKFRNAQGEMELNFLTPPVWELTFSLTDCCPSAKGHKGPAKDKDHEARAPEHPEHPDTPHRK